jgi:hypothetical protein
MSKTINKNILSEYNLQDYILDDEHIQNSLRLKIVKERNERNDKEIKEKNTKIIEKEIKQDKLDKKENINKIFIPLQEDTLFWCYFIIKNGDTAYETLHSKNSLVAKQLKIDLVSIIRKNKDLLKIYKFDTITNIENNLANDHFLNIKTFMALCAIANLNIIYVKKNTYFENFMNDTSVVYIVKEEVSHSKYNKKYGFQIASEENIDTIRTTLYKLDKLDKVIKAMSGYKVEELVQICSKLAIDTINKDNGKTKSKKDLYEAIIQYF